MDTAPKTERVDAEIIVANSTIGVSMVGVEVDCAQDILSALVGALLNTTQRERRDAERERVG